MLTNEIMNTVRELAASEMIKPTITYWKTVDRAAGYVLNDPYQGFALKRFRFSDIQMMRSIKRAS